MYLSELKIKNFRQFNDSASGFTVTFNEGVTALVGENDAGKTAVMDAIRHVLLTRDSELLRLTPEDFHIKPDGTQATEILIACKLSKLNESEKGAFAEYLTYEATDVSLHLYWVARKLNETPGSRRWIEISVRSGPDGNGPGLDSGIRQLLATAYLRPLRDAEREMSSGRGSRLSQILSNFPDIKTGTTFDKDHLPANAEQTALLSLAGLSEYLGHLVGNHEGVSSAQIAINENYLTPLSLSGESLQGRITFAHGGNDSARLRQILERLELDLFEGTTGQSRGNFGLGSNNLLFMACELLLLGKEIDGLPLLLIEEPEAHLHPQRQLRLMEFLEVAAQPPAGSDQRPVQVIVTTHSPNLSSKIPLNNLLLLHKQNVFSLAEGQTKLSKGDYRFLERFLDVTKANLFYARGLIVVEGDGEAILLPTLAKIFGRDLTEHGVSIINVGGTGLGRYSRILQREDPAKGVINMPTACLADLDVMPDCAPVIVGLVENDEDPKWTSPRRRWHAKKDFGATAEEQAENLAARRQKISAGDGQHVKTFISDEWTFEYALAFAGLDKEVYLAANLALNDDPLNEDKKDRTVLEAEMAAAYTTLEETHAADREKLCSIIYDLFKTQKASKSIAAQYLADILQERFESDEINTAWLTERLPTYIKDAITYATTPIVPAAEAPPTEATHA